MLLLGGLFAIGFLCGGQASAAEGVSAAGVSAPEVSVSTLSAPSKPAVPQHGEGQVLSPVTEHITKAVETHVVRPVGDVVEVVGSVTEGLSEVPSSAWPSRPGTELPEFRGLPGADLPAFPAVPTVPTVPAVPTAPAVPAQTLPAPVTPASQPGLEAPESSDGRDDAGRSGKDAAVVYGPWFVAGVGATASHAPASSGTHSSAPSGYAPVQQVPVEHPGGVQGNRSAGDSSTPRHGDAHAVSLNPRAPLRLVPGAAARVEADGIQDRHRDIPVSPA